MLERRRFLTGALAGFATVATACRPASPATAPLPTRREPVARRRVDLDELARAVETLERDALFDRLADDIARGLESDALLAALHAASTRTISTREQFSTEQHILLCAHAVHRATMELGGPTRWRPLLWAVDFYKTAQAHELERTAEPPLPELPASRLPSSTRASREFADAMETFDGARAEAAIVALHRSAPREAVVDILLRYGSKDFRHIGHKAIHVANALQVLDGTGWFHGEEVLRSVALTLALHYEEAGQDPDGPWLRNRARAAAIPAGWQTGRVDDEAVVRLLGTLRGASPDDASEEAVALLRRGVGPQTLWDAMRLSSAELLLNNPTGVEALHAVTATNAACTAFERARRDDDRRLLLLQNVARVADFHRYVAYWAAKRNVPAVSAIALHELEPAGERAASLDEILEGFGGAPPTRQRGAQRALDHLEDPAVDGRQLCRRAFEVAVDRATDNHDFKIVTAALEDAGRTSPRWRGRYLAGCSARFRGLSEPRTAFAERMDRLDPVLRRSAESGMRS